MSTPEPRRVTCNLTPDEKSHLERNRAAVAAELPELASRDRLRKVAAEETTLSGELRRAIHSSSQPLSAIAAAAGLPVLVLDEFLTGERTLRSDVLDRLATFLG